MQGAISQQSTFDEHQRPASLAGWLLIAPMLLWLAAFVVAPTLILVVCSFCQTNDLGGWVYEFTWANYERVFFEPASRTVFVRSLIHAGITTVLCTIIGYPVAYYIGKSPPHMRNILLMLVMIPFWTSFLIRTYAWITLLKTNGPINALLLASGFVTEPIQLLYTNTAVVIGLVYAYLPFMILPVYGSVEKLDNSLIEAAMDLGAGPVRAFTDIILPLTRPGVVAGLLLVFVPSLGMFAISDLLGGGRKPMLGDMINEQFMKSRNPPFGAALGVTLLLMFALAFWCTAWVSRRRADVE